MSLVCTLSPELTGVLGGDIVFLRKPSYIYPFIWILNIVPVQYMYYNVADMSSFSKT